MIETKNRIEEIKEQLDSGELDDWANIALRHHISVLLSEVDRLQEENRDYWNYFVMVRKHIKKRK